MKTFKYEAKLWRGWDRPRDPFTDGDTIWFLVDLGLRTYHASDFRVYDYDAPETFRPSNKSEFLHGKLATMVAEELFENEEAAYGIINIEVYKDGKYGRWLENAHLKTVGDLYKNYMTHIGLYKIKPYDNPTRDVLEGLSAKARKAHPKVYEKWREMYKEFFI